MRVGAPLTLYLPLADLTLLSSFVALSHPPVVHAPIRCDQAHCPRLDLGEATCQRERCETTLEGWGKLSGFALFLELQRSKAALGLPRFVFARVSGERKPFLVDTDCPLAVEVLRHFVRSAPGRHFRRDAMAHLMTLEARPSPALMRRDGARVGSASDLR